MEIKKKSLIRITKRNKWMDGMLGFIQFEPSYNNIYVRMFGRKSGFDAMVYQEEIIVIKGLYLKEESIDE